MQKLFKVIRVITVAPFMAIALCLHLYFGNSNIVTRPVDLAVSIVFLAILPLLSYPLQPLIPRFRDQGREGQRNLAMVGCFLGYMLGLIYVLVTRRGRGMALLFLTYLISGLMITLLNQKFHLRASGHACGVAGPMTTLIFFVGAKGLWMVPVYLISAISSVGMKRHTVAQWLLGSIISPLALLLSWGMLQLV